MRLLLLITVTAALLCSPASAAPIIEGGNETVRLEDKEAVEVDDDGSTPKTGTGGGKSQEQLRYEAVVRKNKAEVRRYEYESTVYKNCIELNVSDCRTPIPADIDPALLATPGSMPAISGEAAAYIAFARLRLNPPKPVIGPSPDLNRWKMAAVGYPLWLSVDGDTSPPAVRDAVANVRVSLEARVRRVSFAMGDGHSVNCTNVTKQWTTSVEPGAKSPACGYTYTKPSLPAKKYTVTATTFWSVAWSTSRESGVIDYAQQSSTQVPVGELQVLVR